jgi:hypothetical protein
LQEEKDTDVKLSTLADELQVISEGDAEEDEEEVPATRGSKAKSAKV